MRSLDRHVGDVALDLVAGVRQLDEEGRILLVARRVRIGLGHHQRHVGDAGGGGKPLLAVQDVILVAVLHRRGLHAGGVGAGGFLGHREADALVAVEQGFEELLLLIFRAVGKDRHHRGVVGPLRVHRQRAEHALAELHLHQRVGQRTEAHAAIFLRHPRAPQARARGPWPAAGRALRRAAWCRVPSPRGCIRHAPIGGLSRGSPWLRPGFRNRSTSRFPRFLFLLVGLEEWHKPAICQRQRQTKFEASRSRTKERAHARSCRSVSRIRLRMDQHLVGPHLCPRRRQGAAAVAAARIFVDACDVASGGAAACRPVHADHRRSAGLWLVGHAAQRRQPHALHQARDGEGDGGGDGAARPCAFRARRSRPRRARVVPAGARSSRPAVETRRARYRADL